MKETQPEDFLNEFEKEIVEAEKWNTPDNITRFILFYIILFLVTFSKEIVEALANRI